MDKSATNEKLEWYAMSSPYNTQLASQRKLQELGIETFVPMQTREQVIKGKRVSKEVPAVSNLLFARSTMSILRQSKEYIKRLQFKVWRREEKNIPIIIPDAQMQNFINACRIAQNRMVFVKEEDINWEAGTPVRIVSGQLKGLQGVLAKVKGKRSRKVAITINQFVSAYIVDVPLEAVERIEEE